MPFPRIVTAPIPPLAIGSPVWIWDENRRFYPPKQPGEIYGSGAPIFREHFRPGKIVGETRVSWLVDAEWTARKLPKRKRVRGVAYSAAELEGQVYCDKHGIKAADMVRCAYPDVVGAVGTLVGFVADPETKGTLYDPKYAIADMVRDCEPDVLRKVVALLEEKTKAKPVKR